MYRVFQVFTIFVINKVVSHAFLVQSLDWRRFEHLKLMELFLRISQVSVYLFFTAPSHTVNIFLALKVPFLDRSNGKLWRVQEPLWLVRGTVGAFETFLVITFFTFFLRILGLISYFILRNVVFIELILGLIVSLCVWLLVLQVVICIENRRKILFLIIIQKLTKLLGSVECVKVKISFLRVVMKKFFSCYLSVLLKLLLSLLVNTFLGQTSFYLLFIVIILLVQVISLF